MVFVIVIFCLIILCILGYEVYKLKKEINKLKEDNKKFQQEEKTKREIGWDSIWKIVNKYH